MHEFTSISVSSYDAASLADKLTEKSAAGWDVVAIVPAGTNITAYLSREGGAAEPAPSWDTDSEDAATAVDDAAAEPALAAAAVTAASDGAEEVDEVEPIDEPVDEPAPVWEPEPVAEEPAPVAEPAGWAVAPEPASPAAASVGVAEASPEPTPYVDTSSGYGDTQATAGADTGDVAEPQLGTTTAGYDTATTGYDTGTSSDAAAESTTGYDTGEATAATTDTDANAGYDAGATAAAATAATTDAGTGYDAGATSDSGASSEAAAAEQTTAAAASAAPAGWYADPSGRFELRYWDGNQWTEHVSRAGQQYTDPPVA
jgi:hypothetical protein